MRYTHDAFFEKVGLELVRIHAQPNKVCYCHRLWVCIPSSTEPTYARLFWEEELFSVYFAVQEDGRDCDPCRPGTSA